LVRPPGRREVYNATGVVHMYGRHFPEGVGSLVFAIRLERNARGRMKKYFIGGKFKGEVGSVNRYTHSRKRTRVNHTGLVKICKGPGKSESRLLGRNGNRPGGKSQHFR